MRKKFARKFKNSKISEFENSNVRNFDIFESWKLGQLETGGKCIEIKYSKFWKLEISAILEIWLIRKLKTIQRYESWKIYDSVISKVEKFGVSEDL